MISLNNGHDKDNKKRHTQVDLNNSDDTTIDIAEDHPLIKHSIQINRTRRSNLYLLCMIFIFLFIILPLIIFFECMKKNENLNLNKLSLRK
jgi:hypothetical protein